MTLLNSLIKTALRRNCIKITMKIYCTNFSSQNSAILSENRNMSFIIHYIFLNGGLRTPKGQLRNTSMTSQYIFQLCQHGKRRCLHPPLPPGGGGGGGVYLIPVRLPSRYEFIQVPSCGSVFVYVHPGSCIADRDFRSGAKTPTSIV